MKEHKNFRIYFLISMLLTMFTACENDWPTKEQTRSLTGEWKLVSIKATDKVTLKDTTWATNGCFIRFGYTGRDGAAPLTYALTPNESIDILYSVPQNDHILFMPKDPVRIYDNSKVGFQLSWMTPFQILEGRLILKGDGLIREGNKIIHDGRKVSLNAIFER